MAFFMPKNGTRWVVFKWRWRITLICLLLLFLLFLLMQSPYVQKLMYPIDYETEVVVSSQAFDVDPHLIMAIIRVESHFRPEVSSHKGAYGLMQLMPDTAQWMVDDGHFEAEFLQRLHEPAVNIHMGSWYVRQLTYEFDGNHVAAIAAYNAGPGRVNGWIQEGEWDGQKKHIEQIPFGETRHYVERVLYYYDKYKSLYPALLTSVTNEDSR